MPSELAIAISEAIDSTANYAEAIDRVIAKNAEIRCSYCDEVSFKGYAVDGSGWSDAARKAMMDHVLSCPSRPEAKLLEKIAELEKDLRASAWQPIESAPKDGRTILLGYENLYGKWRTLRGQWFSEQMIMDEWEEPDDGMEGWYETSAQAGDPPNVCPVSPTHWQPLPLAPKDGKE